jgi:hypothetical protein
VLLRLGVMALLALIGAGLVATVLSLELPRHGLDLTDFIQVLEAGINDVVLIGAAVFFLVTVEGAAVYIRDFQDPVVLAAVNEVEDLTNGLSRKIWQKLMVLHRIHA